MAKHHATYGQTQHSTGLLALSIEPSKFYKDIESAFGSVMGPSIAENAERNLKSWGIDSRNLKLLTTKGSNSRVYSLKGKLLVKITNDVETVQQIPISNPLVLNPYRSTTIGYDMGSVPVGLEVYPQLNTKDVEARHVRAMAYELFTKHHLVFRDNKPDNIGLTEDGTPYIIDRGSITRAHAPEPMQRDFLYPELSGYNFQACGWENNADKHGFVWPEEQKTIRQFQAAAALMKPRTHSASIS